MLFLEQIGNCVHLLALELAFSLVLIVAVPLAASVGVKCSNCPLQMFASCLMLVCSIRS